MKGKSFYLWLSNDFLAKYEVILREKKFAEIFGDSSTNFFYPAMDADFPAKTQYCLCLIFLMLHYYNLLLGQSIKFALKLYGFALKLYELKKLTCE